MSEANKTQHGGDHYRGVEYQHWDFVTDLGLSYLIGCATKYVARWRKKNGAEDLRKALHYIQKAEERRGHETVLSTADVENLDRFCAQITSANDAMAVRQIVLGQYAGATRVIQWLLDALDQED